MAFQPELITQYDSHLKQNVVLAKASPTGNYTKYIFDTKLNGFIEAPEVVRVIDLIPLYESKCDRHGTIFFCSNLAKNRRIYKYFFDSSSNEIHRVQCQCCEFDVSKDGKYIYEGLEFSASFRYLPQAMNINNRAYPIEPKEFVDENSSNYLWIRPHYSTTCMVNNEIVVFAMVYPENYSLEAFNFDPASQEFNPSTCKCEKCTSIQAGYNAFDHGSQGIGYRRTHRDRNGTPLIALAMTWQNGYEGAIEHFSDEHGNIGRYRYNYDLKCFEMEELLDVRVCSNNAKEAKNQPEILYDDGLTVAYFSKCREMNRPFFFGCHIKDTTMRKYTFNELSHQFEIFQCQDCKFDGRTYMMHRASAMGEMSKCKVTGRKIQLTCDKRNIIQKKMQMELETDRIMERAPIKNLLNWDQKKLLSHYKSLNNTVLQTPVVQIFESDGTEKWLTNGYHQEEFVLLMGMDGSVNPYKVKISQMGFMRYFQVDEYGREIEKEQKAPLQPTTPQLPTDSELSDPIPCSISGYTYCPHYKNNLFFTSDNHHLLLSKYDLIEVRCDECFAMPLELKIVNRMFIRFDDGFAWRIDCRKNGNFVQKMMYSEYTKEWDLMMEYRVRLLKNGQHKKVNKEVPTTTIDSSSSTSSITTIIEKPKPVVTTSEAAKNSDSNSEEIEGSESDASDSDDSYEDEDESHDDEEESGESDDEEIATNDVKAVVKDGALESSDSDSESENSDEGSDSDENDSDECEENSVIFKPSTLASTPLKASQNLENVFKPTTQSLASEDFKSLGSECIVGEKPEDLVKAPTTVLDIPESETDEESTTEEDARDKTFTTIPLSSSDNGDAYEEDHEDVDREYSRIERENACSELPESIWDTPPTGICSIS